MTIAYILFFLSGDVQGTLGWVGVLPLVSAAVYFGVRGALLVSLLNILAQGTLASVFNPPISVFVFLGSITPLYLGLSIVLGWVSGQMARLLEHGQNLQQVKRRENRTWRT